MLEGYGTRLELSEVAHIAGYVRVFEPTLGWCGGRYVLSGGCERHVEGLGDDVSSLKA